MGKYDDFEITSIGARCFNRWFLCGRSGLRYISSPLDNADNKDEHEFANILAFVKEGFSQIREDALEKNIQRNAVNLETGKAMDYHGYTYAGDGLEGHFYLPHFFDVQESGMFLNDENGWARWRHKVDLFMAMLADGKRKIVLSSSRAYHDTPETRKTVAGEMREFAGYLASKYGRTPENTLVFSFVICECDKVSVELDEPMAKQIAVPMRQEDYEAHTDLKLNWTNKFYQDEFRKALGV